MVNEESDLFRRHAEWVLRTRHRLADEGRHQLVLNFLATLRDGRHPERQL